MRTAATRLNELWKDTARAFWIDDYYTKSHADQNTHITVTMGIPADQIGGHANLLDTSEMLFVDPKHVRRNKIAPGGGYPNSGVSGSEGRQKAKGKRQKQSGSDGNKVHNDENKVQRKDANVL